MGIVKFIKTTSEKYSALESKVAGAIYYVLDADSNIGRIYVDGFCYGEANSEGKSVFDITKDGDSLKITYTDGSSKTVEAGKTYTAGDGISISEANEISALEKIGQDLTVTQATGAIASGKKITSDMSIKEILLQMLQQVKQPGDPTLPKVTVTLSGAGAKEVGSKFTPSYSVSFNAGSYTYGPATGVKATAYTVSDSNSNAATTATGSFAEFTVGDSTNYKVSATADYDEGVVAVDNTGATSNPVVKISAGTTASVSSAAVTGFRPYFYGSKTAIVESYDSAAVRALTNSGKAYNGMFKISFPDGTKQIVFAAPAKYSLKSVINVNLSRGEVADTFEKSTVQVEGANGYTAAAYNVWVFDSATSLDANTFEVTLGIKED